MFYVLLAGWIMVAVSKLARCRECTVSVFKQNTRTAIHSAYIRTRKVQVHTVNKFQLASNRQPLQILFASHLTEFGDEHQSTRQ